MIWQPEFTDKTLSRNPGRFRTGVLKRFIEIEGLGHVSFPFGCILLE